jgi:GntR family transcriptional regulator/MocR family aminotransferase
VVVPIPVDARGLDVDRLADHAAVLLAPAHSYPTGATLDRERRRALLAWARAADALVIEDDYDADLRYDRTPIGALQGQAPEHVAYVGSASKTFSPALRLGWIAAPAHLAAALAREKRLDDMGTSLIDQLAFARFVDAGELARHLRRTRPIYRRRRDAVIDELGRVLPEAVATGAAAGLHLHLALPAGTDVRALVQAAYRRGVLLEDAAIHWADPAAAPPALVLGYGSLDEATVPSAIAAIGPLPRHRIGSSARDRSVEAWP